MKKLLLALLAVGLCSSGSVFAAQCVRNLDANNNGIYEEGEVDPCQEYPAGPCTCYCPVTKFRPQYYQTCRCEQEPYQVYKRCCKQVPQEYEVQQCRYVPQYYTVKRCRMVPEYYYTCETRYRNKYCYDKHCRYVPYTTVKKCCVPNACGADADNSQSGSQSVQGSQR